MRIQKKVIRCATTFSSPAISLFICNNLTTTYDKGDVEVALSYASFIGQTTSLGNGQLLGQLSTVIRSQGSCWALANAEVMSDRLCIQSNARYTSVPGYQCVKPKESGKAGWFLQYLVQVHISDTDLLACCGSYCGHGCEGGWASRAWGYFTSSGLCTGGPYGDKNSCKPYAFYPCGTHANQTYYGPCKSEKWQTPTCRSICQFRYRKNYTEDKFWGRTGYYVFGNETNIRREIYERGPVIATFQVYSDFSYYTEGVYIRKSESQQGTHAVKIVGWGIDRTNGTIPYWLVANSWNTDWGEDGFFRIIRGTDECGIESNIIGGSLIIYNVH